MRYVGVDLHKRSFTVCFLEGEKKELKHYKVNGKDIELFRDELREEDEVAIESTGGTRYLIKKIRDKVKTIRVVNPLQFKVISESAKKTDEEDAVKIAYFLSKGMIPEVRIKGQEEEELMSIIRTREKLVKFRSSLKNKIHGILSANGIMTMSEEFSSEKGLERVERLGLSEGYKIELKVIIEQIRSVNKGIEEIEKRIKEKGEKMKGYKNITSITGIGSLIGTILLNRIGAIENFKNAKKLAGYIGIVPRVEVSGGKARNRGITKMGDKLARTALVQATLVSIRYNRYLRSFYLRLKSKKGSGKAIIATANKLLRIIYNTLKNDLVFEDFKKYQLAKG